MKLVPLKAVCLSWSSINLHHIGCHPPFDLFCSFSTTTKNMFMINSQKLQNCTADCRVWETSEFEIPSIRQYSTYLNVSECPHSSIWLGDFNQQQLISNLHSRTLCWCQFLGRCCCFSSILILGSFQQFHGIKCWKCGKVRPVPWNLSTIRFWRYKNIMCTEMLHFHRPLDFITHCHLGCLVNHVCSLKTLVGNMKLEQHTNGVRQATSSSSMLNPPTTNGLLAATSSSSNRTSRVSSSKLYSIRMSSGGHQQWYAGQPGSQNKYFRMFYHPVSELQVSDV